MSPVKPLAVFACLPPGNSAIARYTLNSLASMRIPIHFFSAHSTYDDWQFCQEMIRKTRLHRLYHSDCFDEAYQLHGYQDSLFVLGNSFHHREVLKSLLRNSRIYPIRTHVHIHEAQLAYAWLSVFSENIGPLLEFYRIFYPKKEKCFSGRPSIFESDVYGLRILSALALPDTIITNSRFCSRMVAQEIKGLVKVPEIEQAFLPVISNGDGANAILKEPGVPIRVGSFGIPHKVKHIDVIVKACKYLQENHKEIELVLAGSEISSFLTHNGLMEDFIRPVDSPTDQQMISLMESVDIGIQLRWPSHGESSACVNELLALGKRVILTNNGSFSELGDYAVLTPVEVKPVELGNYILSCTEFTPDVDRYLSKFSVEAFQQRLLQIIMTKER